MDLKVYKCNKCGALVISFDEDEMECCGENMVEQIPNSVDASFEKHLPTYTIEGNKMIAEVHHVMEEEHYIMWIKLVYENSEKTFYFKPGDVPEVNSKYEPGMKAYAYCNNHGLWVRDVV